MSKKLFWFVGFFIFVADQFSKIHVCRSLFLGQSVTVIKNIFHISLVHNTGIAFGIFKGKTPLFIILSVIVIIYVTLRSVLRAEQYLFSKHLAMGLILGGAFGNLLDRLRLGYVVDFLDFRIWPVFNIADSAITIGIILLAVELFIKPKKT